MSKITTFFITFNLFVLGANSVHATETFVEAAMQKEYKRTEKKINQLFQEKIEKINERVSLPAEMKSLLIRQSDEIRAFDLKMLKEKMDLKVKHAQKRDELKDELVADAQNKVRWQIDAEQRFQDEKKRHEKEKKELKEKLRKKTEQENKTSPKPVTSNVEPKDEKTSAVNTKVEKK